MRPKSSGRKKRSHLAERAVSKTAERRGAVEMEDADAPGFGKRRKNSVRSMRVFVFRRPFYTDTPQKGANKHQSSLTFSMIEGVRKCLDPKRQRWALRRALTAVEWTGRIGVWGNVGDTERGAWGGG